MDDAAVRRDGHGGGDEPPVPLPARARPDGPLDRPSTCRRRWATTRITRAPRARWARRASRSTRSTTCAACSTQIPLDAVSTSMTINATAPILLLLYELVAEEQGVEADRPGGNGAERHPQGVRGARHVHLPAAARRCGSSPTCSRTATSASPSGTRSRSAAITCARRARRRRRRSRSRSRTASRTCRRRSTPGSRSTTSAPRLSFFFACHQHFFEEVAKFRAARRLWAKIMKERFGALDERRRCCASIRRPAARPSPPSSPRTTSCGRRSRRSRRCSAGRSRCTRTRSTRRSRFRPRRRPSSRFAPSR